MRFSLKTLFFATAFVGLVLAYSLSVYRRGEAQKVAWLAGSEISGFIDLYYDYEVEIKGDEFPELKKTTPPLPGWVYRWIPPEYLHKIVAAEIDLPDDRVQELVPLSVLPHLKALSVDWPRYFDGEMPHFRKFRQLEYLELPHADNLTDRGVQELVHLDRLKVLTITGDQITESGIEELRRKSPQCIINGRRGG